MDVEQLPLAGQIVVVVDVVVVELFESTVMMAGVELLDRLVCGSLLSMTNTLYL